MWFKHVRTLRRRLDIATLAALARHWTGPLAGYFAVRFGARSLMSVYIVLWSAFTVMTGFATGAISLLSLFCLGFHAEKRIE